MQNREREKRAGERRERDRRHIGQPVRPTETRHATLHSAPGGGGLETRHEALRKGCRLAVPEVTSPAAAGVCQTEFVEAPQSDGGNNHIENNQSPIREDVRRARLKPMRRPNHERRERKSGGKCSGSPNG